MAGLWPHFIDDLTKEETIGMRSLKGLMASMAQSSATPAHSWACLLLPPLRSFLSELSSGLVAGLWPSLPLLNLSEATAAQAQFKMERLVPSPDSILHGAEQEFLLKIQPCESNECIYRSHTHPLPALGPHSWRFVGSGKGFLPREKEKLDSEGQCWTWTRLGDCFTFHSFLAAQETVLTLAVSQNFTLFLLQVLPHIGPLGAVQTPWGDNLQFRSGKLISYVHILRVLSIWLLHRNCSYCLLLNFCRLYSNRLPILWVNYCYHII